MKRSADMAEHPHRPTPTKSAPAQRDALPHRQRSIAFDQSPPKLSILLDALQSAAVQRPLDTVAPPLVLPPWWEQPLSELLLLVRSGQLKLQYDTSIDDQLLWLIQQPFVCGRPQSGELVVELFRLEEDLPYQ